MKGEPDRMPAEITTEPSEPTGGARVYLALLIEQWDLPWPSSMFEERVLEFGEVVEEARQYLIEAK